ncbi:FAD binding domain containing protein [Pyrenophora teres f. teres]|uniref:FAD binding domain containing protein n=1 Tax=Pyrenophora teres f. teres TaxID=97479 RepID=A0A6S6W559_9PLEO|nr:FAD binding domain containing protein [Pyrenophora teres f. teres]
MKVFVSLGAFVAAVSAQIDTFEPADFNVTKALILNGVNVSAIPELAGLAKQSALSGCSIACSSLQLIYGDSKVLSEGSTTYQAFTSSYWSVQQGNIDPQCIFKPTNTVEVSSLVLISRLTQCPFAVKGGGHAAFAGASSIADGITVSMERMNHVVVSKDKKYANVGPGNRWVDVYKTVEKSGVNVVGGRMAPVGVPGLILGGGISFFSNKRGWACDNIAAYEVVTACGLVVTATPQDYPDLYWALRGGGNNFGIVTNFKMDAFPLGKMWGGQRIFTENNFPAVLDAVYKFATVGSSKDTDAAEIVSFSNLPSLGNIAIVQTHYAQPVANASVFADLNAITPVVDDTSISYLSDLTIKMNGGSPNDTLGKLQTQWDATFHVDRELFTFLVDTFYALLPDVQNLEGAFPVISIQAITEGQLKGMQKNGGNALGMTLGNGPIFIMNMSASFSNAADEAAFLKFFSTIIKKVKAEAVRGGVDNEYIYMNYASQFMDPIATYGAANQQKLVAISKKYDPTQLFQNLLPGHFKLAKGAPNPNMP